MVTPTRGRGSQRLLKEQGRDRSLPIPKPWGSFLPGPPAPALTLKSAESCDPPWQRGMSQWMDLVPGCSSAVCSGLLSSCARLGGTGGEGVTRRATAPSPPNASTHLLTPLGTGSCRRTLRAWLEFEMRGSGARLCRGPPGPSGHLPLGGQVTAELQIQPEPAGKRGWAELGSTLEMVMVMHRPPPPTRLPVGSWSTVGKRRKGRGEGMSSASWYCMSVSCRRQGSWGAAAAHPPPPAIPSVAWRSSPPPGSGSPSGPSRSQTRPA